jgi:hypothetical protein
LSQQGENGILDWDIHEQLLKKIGFDPVKECDEFQAGPDNDKLPSLCFFLPRVGDMLGNTITANGYFPQKYPIVVKVRGSHEVSPRIGFFSKDGKQYLDVQLGDVQLAFYALQVDPNVPADKNGVPTLKLDANGDPIILSMNPNDKDPENGQIIKVLLSATIAAEISNFVTDETKPSNLKLTIRPEPTLSKIVFKPIPGGNATIVPDRNLISAMEEMIKYGLNIYSEPDKALKIGLPKDIVLGGGTSSGGDLFKSLGLEKISFGADGLGLKIEDSQEFLDLMLKIKN